MNKNIKLTLILCLLFVAFVFVMTYFRITSNNAATLSPEALREAGALVYEEPVVLAPFSLLDHRGNAFTQDKLVGKWSLIFFGFTSCPDICPLTLTELSQFYQQLKVASPGDETQIIMVSVDPQRDTTEKMAEYMSSFHEDFVGLNGPYEDVASLARQLFIAHEPPPPVVQVPNDPHVGHVMSAPTDYEIDHSGNILIINPDGRYHGFFDAAIQDRELTLAYQSIRSDY